MKSVKYLLIGGGLASAGAARKIREVDPRSPILIVSQEAHLPYHRPPLTKEYMTGKKPQEKVFIEGPDFWSSRNIELIAGQEVNRLDVGRKVAGLSRGESIQFEKALIATGGRPRRLDIPGGNLSGVHYFRTLDDAIAVSREAHSGRRAVVVGGGFIAIELASSLTQRGVSVSVIERKPRIWSHFMNAALAGFFQAYCEQRGVAFYLNSAVKSIQGNGRVSGVELAGGELLPCDFVVIAAGIELNIQLAQDAQLQTGDGIIVDDGMRTSSPDIYAAGDIANYPDPYFGYRRRVEHWGQADYTGPLAGANMAGQEQHYDLLTYIWTDIFDLHMEVGGNEHECDQTITRGQMAGGSFAQICLKDARAMAYFAVNLKKAQYQPLSQLIEQKVDLRGKEKQLEDPGFDIGRLLAQPAGTRS